MSNIAVTETTVSLTERGRKAAVRFLEHKGYLVHDCEFQCEGIDWMVAELEDTIAFVVVKTRSNTDAGLPEESVDEKIRTSFEKAAVSFLEKNEQLVDKCIRADVISILVFAHDRAFLRHHVNAFAVA